jgi:hypothetical protein
VQGARGGDLFLEGERERRSRERAGSWGVDPVRTVFGSVPTLLADCSGQARGTGGTTPTVPRVHSARPEEWVQPTTVGTSWSGSDGVSSEI